LDRQFSLTLKRFKKWWQMAALPPLSESRRRTQTLHDRAERLAQVQKWPRDTWTCFMAMRRALFDLIPCGWQFAGEQVSASRHSTRLNVLGLLNRSHQRGTMWPARIRSMRLTSSDAR
jgi:hypothetical protein